ncbi:MAG: hypothetical protein HRT87_11195 [Legionellales bacterium]|nr:hypothetical protein [Legionellales bacterium]
MKNIEIVFILLLSLVSNIFAVKTIEVKYTITREFDSAKINIIQYPQFNDHWCCGTDGLGNCCSASNTIVEESVIHSPINITRTVSYSIPDNVEYIDVELEGETNYNIGQLFCCLINCNISTFCQDNKSSEHGVFDIRHVDSLSIPLTL